MDDKDISKAANYCRIVELQNTNEIMNGEYDINKFIISKSLISKSLNGYKDHDRIAHKDF